MNVMGFKRVLLFAILLGVTSLAMARSSNKTEKALEASLKVYAQAVRWNDFETAYASTDPTLRATEGFTEDDEAYYKRFQISGYTVKSTAKADPQTYSQRVELRIIDVSTQTERTQTDRQNWRWDGAAKRWWLVSGLPRLD
jgi:hypothetical protein